TGRTTADGRRIISVEAWACRTMAISYHMLAATSTWRATAARPRPQRWPWPRSPVDEVTASRRAPDELAPLWSLQGCKGLTSALLIIYQLEGGNRHQVGKQHDAQLNQGSPRPSKRAPFCRRDA